MNFVVSQPAVVAVPVAGSDQQFPVRRIYCVGRNYVEHAKEMGFTGREPPFFFMKPTDAILYVPAGKTGEMPYPQATNNMHYEMEMVVAVGKQGKNIKKEDAEQYIYGYACGLDMTRRDCQFAMRDKGRPWEIGKAFDHSAPIGPIHPASQVGFIDSGVIQLEVNGEKKQSSDIAKLIWNVAETIEHLSGFFELYPGDLIYSGTPEGVGAVKPGDLLSGRIDKLGSLQIKIA